MRFADVIKRELNLLRGGIHFIGCSKNKPFIRTLVWSKILSAKQAENSDKDVKDAKSSEVETAAQPETPPVLNVASPNPAEQEVKPSDAKVILENVKEQSLNKHTTAAETLKQIKEKIFDSKPKESEPEKGEFCG